MVKYFELEKQYKKLENVIPKRVNKVLSSGKYILGEEVENFERAFAHFCGVKYAIGVASGTDALILGLKAAGIVPGDEVIVPSFTFVASVFSIMHAGAKPVFVDVDPKTYLMDPATVEKMIGKKTKAILPVHLYGHAASMAAIKRIAKKYGLKIIEDCAQAHGASFKGKKVGALGDVGCFSFYPTKNLGAFGDGGVITTNNKKIADKAFKLRNLGRFNMKDIFMPHEELGVTSRLDAIQAAILDIKLKYLDAYNRGRRKVASLYGEELKGLPLQLPTEAKDCHHVYHLFVVLVPEGKRDKLRDYLQKQGIPSLIHYPIPVHKQPPCVGKRFRKGPLPVTNKLSAQILSLPMYPEMEASEVKKVCAAIRSFYA